MRLLEGIVVDAKPGSATIHLTNYGIKEQVLSKQDLRYGEIVKVAYDCLNHKIRFILRKGEDIEEKMQGYLSEKMDDVWPGAYFVVGD